jgi:uncharacterized membrane protein
MTRPSYDWHPRIDTGTFADRSVDKIVGFLGSFKYLLWQSVLLFCWVFFNTVALPYAWLHHFDPYPFIFLNLAMSAQAAYAAPLILAAGVRADIKREAIAAETHDGVAELREHSRQSHAEIQQLREDIMQYVFNERPRR